MDKNAVFIGCGVLTWNRGERVTDRYGTVFLQNDENSDDIVPLEGHSSYGEKGTLLADVKKTRNSPHIGDLFRGLYPSTPEVGDKVVLGEGTLFFEEFSANLMIDWSTPSTIEFSNM